MNVTSKCKVSQRPKQFMSSPVGKCLFFKLETFNGNVAVGLKPCIFIVSILTFLHKSLPLVTLHVCLFAQI